MNPQADSRFYERVLAVAALAVLALLFYRIVEPFLTPLAWAIFLGFMLQPLHARLTRLLRGRDSASSLILAVLVLILFVGPLAALAVAFARQAGELAGMFQLWIAEQQDRSISDLGNLPVVGPLLDWLDQNLQISATQVQAWLLEGGKRLFEQLAAVGGSALLGALGTVLAFTAMIFLLFFFIRDGRAMAVAAIELVPMPVERREELRERIGSVARAVVQGTLLTSLIQGLLLGIGFAAVGLPAPVVFGVLGAVLSVVPFGGTALVWAPAVIYLLIQGRYVTAIVLIVIGAIVSSIDNFIKPLLISGRTPVPTLAVFIGVLGGLIAFGVIGLFLGPVVIALVLALAGFARDTKNPAWT